MKLYQRIVYTGVVLGALAGCGPNNSPSVLEETVRGIPVSVITTQGTHGYGRLSCVIEVDDNEYLLCHTSNASSIAEAIDAGALIESELRDEDLDSIEISGYKEGNKFKMNHVTANGYSIDLR